MVVYIQGGTYPGIPSMVVYIQGGIYPGMPPYVHPGGIYPGMLPYVHPGMYHPVYHPVYHPMYTLGTPGTDCTPGPTSALFGVREERALGSEREKPLRRELPASHGPQECDSSSASLRIVTPALGTLKCERLDRHRVTLR